MTDCLGDCFERDEENRRVLKLKANGGIRCTVDGFETFPHDQNFDSNYIAHTAWQDYLLSTPNPINSGILAPASDGIQHATGITGQTITNAFTSNAVVRIEAKGDLYIMPKSPYAAAIAQLEVKVTVDGINWAPIAHSAYHSITDNVAFTSGQIGARWQIAPGETITPLFGIFYTNISGDGAAFIRATSLYVSTTLHAQ